MDNKDLALNLNIDSNALDFELAKSVGLYFRLNKEEIDKIIHEVLQVAKNWKIVAIEIRICRSEQELMENAFNFLMTKKYKKITLKLYYLE